MKPFRFTSGAYAQIAKIHAHIAADSPQAADKVVKRIESVAVLLGEQPHIGHKLRYRSERVFPVKPYPYLVFYRLADGCVHITRVRHAARRRPALQEQAMEFRR
jgi:plasmid stabilization system protein ParE